MVLKKQEKPEVQVFDLPDDINPEKSAINKSIKSQNVFKCLRCEDSFGVIEDLAKHLKLPPVKLHCSMLAEDAIIAAIDNFIKKS